MHGGRRACRLPSENQDQLYRAAKVAVAEAFKARNQEAGRLRRRYRGVRTSVQGAHSEASLSVFGLEAPPAENVPEVREGCTDAVVRLRQPRIAANLGESDTGQELDLDRLATGMETELGVFRGTLDAVTEAQKQRDMELVARKAAARRLRSVFPALFPRRHAHGMTAIYLRGRAGSSGTLGRRLAYDVRNPSRQRSIS